MISQHVRRVDQLDAIVLDNELFTLLNAQYRKVLSCIPSHIIAKNGPEFDAFFRFLFKYMPLRYIGSTFGQNVFNFRYFDDQLSSAPLYKLSLLTILDVCLPWFWERIFKKFFLNSIHGDQLQLNRFESRCIVLWKLLSLLNFCIFLQKSNFSTVFERILKLRPLHEVPPNIQLPQLESVTRELLWHGLSEFIGFTLPLINVYRIKNYLSSVWLSFNSNNRFKFRFKTHNCLICGDVPNFPHTIGCKHVFCYYCIASMLLADPHFKCLYCRFSASGIHSIKPLPINRPEGQKPRGDLCT